jgi:hypothetical protein
MNILKDPAIVTAVLCSEKSGADGHLPRRTGPPLMVETGMADPEFPDQIVEFTLELCFVGRGKDAFLMSLGNSTPIDTVQFRIVKFLLTGFDNLIEDRPGLILRQ